MPSPPLDIPTLLTPLRWARMAIPDLADQVAQLRKEAQSWPSWCYVPLDPFLVLPPNERVKAHAMAQWQIGKGVYRFDPDVFDAVVATSAESVDARVFQKLPEWSIYIPTPGLQTGGFEGSPGFWVNNILFGGEPYLGVLIQAAWGDLSYIMLDLSMGGTVEDLAWAVAHRDNVQKNHPGLLEDGGDPLDLPELPELPSDYVDRVFLWTAALLPRLALVTYLCTVDSDIQAKPGSRPKTKQGKRDRKRRRDRGRPASEIRSWDVGIRMGARLRRARRLYENASSGSGSRKRPHVRAGHFQSFWTGKRVLPDGTRQKGEELIVKWVPPVLVNGTEVDELPITVRPVDGEGAN